MKRDNIGNKYEFEKDYIIGKTLKNEEFLISYEDYEKVSPYTWRFHHSGYLITNMKIDKKRKTVTLHTYLFGRHKNKIIDHINRKKYDNRRENIRIIISSLNGFNTDLQVNNTSGKSGVSYHKKNNCWVSSIKYNYKTTFIREKNKIIKKTKLKSYSIQVNDNGKTCRIVQTNKGNSQFAPIKIINTLKIRL
jgi:hypothetical protein